MTTGNVGCILEYLLSVLGSQGMVTIQNTTLSLILLSKFEIPTQRKDYDLEACGNAADF